MANGIFLRRGLIAAFPSPTPNQLFYPRCDLLGAYHRRALIQMRVNLGAALRLVPQEGTRDGHAFPCE